MNHPERFTQSRVSDRITVETPEVITEEPLTATALDTFLQLADKNRINYYYVGKNSGSFGSVEASALRWWLTNHHREFNFSQRSDGTLVLRWKHLG